MIQAEISNYAKDKKIDLLERESLILKDIQINVECKFPLNKPQKRTVETNRWHQIMGYLIDSNEKCAVRIEDGDIVVGDESSYVLDLPTNIFMSNRNLEIICEFYDSLAVAKIEFSPFYRN